MPEDADDLATEAALEMELAEAKESYRANRDDEAAKQRLADAKQSIIAARQQRRSAGVTIGGDAVASEEG